MYGPPQDIVFMRNAHIMRANAFFAIKRYRDAYRDAQWAQFLDANANVTAIVFACGHKKYREQQIPPQEDLLDLGEEEIEDYLHPAVDLQYSEVKGWYYVAKANIPYASLVMADIPLIAELKRDL